MLYPDQHPSELCGSRKNGRDFGGAVGPGQILPSTLKRYAGIYVESVPFSFSEAKKLTGPDVATAQRILNRYYSGNGRQLAVDGILGKKSRALLKRFRDEEGGRWKSVCKMRGLNRCTRVALLAVAAAHKWRYDPEKDLIARHLGLSGPSNPWVPEHAAVAVALYLKDLGVKGINGVGAYYTGPGRVKSRAAKRYAKKVRAARADVEMVVQKILQAFRVIDLPEENAEGTRRRMTAE